MLHNFIVITNAILPLVIMVFCGFLLRKYKILSPQAVSDLNNLAFKFLLPFNLYISIINSDILKTFRADYFISVNLILFLAYIIQKPFILLLCKENRKRSPLLMATFRANVLALGTPLVNNIYGQKAVAILALFLAFITPLSNALAVIIYERNKGRKQAFTELLLNILKNPFVVALILAFLTNLLGIKFPQFVTTTFGYINSAVTPLCLIGVGGTFVFTTIKNNGKYLTMATLSKLVITPIITTIVCYFIGYRNEELLSMFILFSGPIAISSYAMARNMGGDDELASQIVLVTTCLSVFTIFLWLMFYAQSGMMILN